MVNLESMEEKADKVVAFLWKHEEYLALGCSLYG